MSLRILVWHWGRRGAGPRYAAELAAALGELPGVTAILSLSTQAEILRLPAPPACAMPVATYRSAIGGLGRALAAPLDSRRLAARLRGQHVDLAICAMPAALDLVMVAALRAAGVPYAAILHDADAHPGDRFRVPRRLRGMLAQRAAAVLALSRHVADRLLALGYADPARLVLTRHPPMAYGPPPPPPGSHGGRVRLLFFGRLLPYKGLDLLADAWPLVERPERFELRIAGHGPDGPALARLRAAGVAVDNRWIPETEVGGLLAWADAMVLSHREASQSGVAAAGVAAGRWLVATRVGGLIEQLQHWPGALLCEADAASLAAAIGRLGDAPPPPPVPADPRAEWRLAAGHMVAELSEVIALPGGVYRAAALL